MSILIRNCLLNESEQDIFIDENKISKIGRHLTGTAEHEIDGTCKAAIPSFFNCHTHAAMTLFRGYADDMQLQEWLSTKIWPAEQKLSEKDVYVGTKLACLEMIKSGTTFFNDMYWHWHGTAKAAHEMGLRAAVSAVFIDLSDPEKADEQIKRNQQLYKERTFYPERIQYVLGPHALYTVSTSSLIWTAEFARKNGLRIHLHLSETEKEVADCVKQHGKRPVEYLDSIGFLGENVVACHAVWLDAKEIGLLAKNKVKVVHNPTSNMKLAVGEACNFDELQRAGVSVCLGTDGCASNNNLDMLEEMKIASLLQKHNRKDPTAMLAEEAFRMATINGAKAFGINAGAIEEGKLADMLLIDLKRPELVPNHNLISNLVYSANGGCVDTTICDGKILMQNRVVEDEDKILEQAEKTARKLFSG